MLARRPRLGPFAARQGARYILCMPWMTTEEAAEELGYHPETIREMLRSGRLQGRKFGNVWWVDSASVDRFRVRIEQLGLNKNDPRRGEE